MELDIKKSIADAIDWAKTRNKKEKLYFSSVCETLVNQNYEDIKDDPKIKQLKKVCEDVGLCFTDYEIYGNKTNDLNDKLNFFRKGTDDVTKKVFIEMYELLEHINEIDFSPSQGISFKSNIAKINYNDFCNLEYFSKDNIYFINCALNYIKIKDLDYLKKIYSDEEERDVENEIEDIYIYYAGYKVKKGSESNEILYLIKTILNPQILVDDMLKHFYLCIAMDYGGISCKTLMKIEDKNSKAYYNLLQNLKAFKYGMKYIEKEYIKSINISNEIDYKFLDGKLIIQYSNIDNIVDFFNKRKYKPIFIEQDLIQDCFDNHYTICLMYNNINYLSFYLTKKTEDNQYHIDIVHLNHEIKSIVDSISKGNAKFKEEAPKKINKIYSTITDAFSSNDCISEVQIISPGYNHATGMHKKKLRTFVLI